MKNINQLIIFLALCGAGVMAQASGVLNPDCTPQKAAKSAAAKSTIGIGGRCSPSKTIKDTGKRAAGIEDKGVIEKHRKDDKGVMGKAADSINKN